MGYLHIGQDLIINSKDIIAILNIEYVKNTKEYKKLYKRLEEKGSIINISEKRKVSFILVNKRYEEKAYISNIAVNTIAKRLL